MYTEYWRLKEKPFENGPDLRFAYMAGQYKEGLARLIYACGEKKPVSLLIGDAGCGKTFIRRLLVKRLGSIGNFMVALISNPLIGINEIFDDIRIQIAGDSPEFSSQGAVLRELRKLLIARKSEGYHNLIIIEDAHLIKDGDTLEQLSLLADLYDEKAGSLLSIVLFSRPELIKVLEGHKGLRQRVESHWVIETLNADQTRDYITHRLSVAGGNGWIIGDDAAGKIHEYSAGVIRTINTVCDLALYLGMSENAVRVDAGMVERIIRDMEYGVPDDNEG